MTMADNFDPNVPGQIQGDVTGLAVIDPAATFVGELGNLVVDPDRDFQVKVDWEVFEQFAPLFLNGAGDWDVRVYAESVGPGDEIEIGRVGVPANAGGACAIHGGPPCSGFSATVNVPARTLQEDIPGQQSGVYKLVATVFLDTPLVGQPYDMSGYREGPVIRVESPQ